MASDDRGIELTSRLSRALDAGLLPGDSASRGQAILERLNRPLRLALVGQEQAGKSTLVNLLAGVEVLSTKYDLPTVEVTWGEEDEAECHLADGNSVTLPHADPKRIAELQPSFVTIRRPLPALKKISLLEVTIPGDMTGMARAAHWAADRADVMLWVSAGFDTNEQAVWQALPDTTKDHGFLLLSKADLLEQQGVLDRAMGVLHKNFRDEFNTIQPIEGLRALAARGPDGNVDKQELRASGAMPLIAAVLKQVEEARRAALDMADVLLARYSEKLAVLDSLPAPEPEPEPAPEQAADPARPKTQTLDDIVEARDISNVTVLRPPSRPLDPATDGKLHPDTREAFKQALGYLWARSEELFAQFETLGADAPAEVIDRSVMHLNWISDYLSEHGHEGDPALTRARNNAFDAADLALLMQMEETDSAAVEALSLMIQIKHELQAELAA